MDAQRDMTSGDSGTAEPSVSSALERLGAAGQGVIAKRIDLALLEGHELLSRALGGAALVGAGMVLAAAAWFAVAAGFTLSITPADNLVVRLAVFGLLNGGGAVGLVALGMRRARSQRLVRPYGSVSSTPADP
jgi:uncharacterized membrane protein YqjE